MLLKCSNVCLYLFSYWRRTLCSPAAKVLKILQNCNLLHLCKQGLQRFSMDTKKPEDFNLPYLRERDLACGIPFCSPQGPLQICRKGGSRTYRIIENHKISIGCKLSVYKIAKCIETHRVHFDI